MRDLIKRAGLTNKEVADILGVTPVTIWNYSNGTLPRTEMKRQQLNTFRAILQKLIEAGKLPRHDIPYTPRMSAETRSRRVALMKKIRKLLDDRTRACSTNM